MYEKMFTEHRPSEARLQSYGLPKIKENPQNVHPELQRTLLI